MYKNKRKYFCKNSYQKDYEMDELSNPNFWNDVYKKTKVYFGLAAIQDNFNKIIESDMYKLFNLNTFKLILNNVRDYFKNLYAINNNWDQNDIISNMPFKIIEEKYYNENGYLKYDLTFAIKRKIDNSDIYIIGDIHSSLHSLLDIIFDLRRKNVFINENSFELKQNKYIIFLGDIIDRGPYNVELLVFIFMLQLKNEDRVIIINGNHEDATQYEKKNVGAGTLLEIKKQFPNINSEDINLFNSTLNYLPSVLFLNFNNNLYQLNHGSFSYNFIREPLSTEKLEKKKF